MSCFNCKQDTDLHTFEIKMMVCTFCLPKLDAIFSNPFKIAQYLLMLKGEKEVTGMSVTLDGKEVTNGIT